MNLTADEQQMVDLVAEFVDERVRPRVRDFEQDDIYPAEFIEARTRFNLAETEADDGMPPLVSREIH